MARRESRAARGAQDSGIVSPEYVHGYGTREQQRLVEQAEHWRHRLIADGTELPPGTRLLEIGSGVGAVLAVLGQEFPGVRLTGLDIEPAQLEFARPYWWTDEDLARQALYAADVVESALDALAQLPGADEEELRRGLDDMRSLPDIPGAGIGWVVHKSTARG